MGLIPDVTVDLVVTSPPYPMIEMWDEPLAKADPAISSALNVGDGSAAFELMHRQLDQVWAESHRVLRQGGFLCINVGDATRKVKDNFRLYSNHSRIVSHCESLGFQSLPLILWRKQTNAPNKFMGSGMLPSGAYATLEHEYVLVLRKGGKRDFSQAEAEIRRESAFFWEERNIWFSDMWDLKGARQVLAPNEGRSRSAAYPLELVHRLINMYSMQGDLVLDPFLGTGTTAAACVLNARNSVGFELLEGFSPIIQETMETMGRVANGLVAERLRAHLSFVENYQDRHGKTLGHTNSTYGFPVMTTQEVELRLLGLESLSESLSESGELQFTAAHTPAGLDSQGQDTLVKIGTRDDSSGQSDQLTLSFDR
ncbi:MAG: site-specific DNA-methyltransferase [Spirochaetaceae bacterium]|nr:MAG: site-specific DNA-methyltransferase [Spirochaetaceae bacterium]